MERRVEEHIIYELSADEVAAAIKYWLECAQHLPVFVDRENVHISMDGTATVLSTLTDVTNRGEQTKFVKA